jgi:hypothetical protein
MTGKPPTTTRRKWVLRQLRTFALFGVNSTAGWALYLMGDHVALPWPLYPLGGALFLWAGAKRLIEDAMEGE